MFGQLCKMYVKHLHLKYVSTPSCAVSGQLSKVGKLSKVLLARGEGSASYQCALVMGDVQARAGLLER